MPDLTLALDKLHDPRLTPTSPPVGSCADRLTAAGLALVAIMRVAPPGLQADEVTINARTGRLAIYVDDLAQSEDFAARLGLSQTRPVDMGDGTVVHRWFGQWADWPVTVIRWPALPAGDDR